MLGDVARRGRAFAVGGGDVARRDKAYVVSEAVPFGHPSCRYSDESHRDQQEIAHARVAVVAAVAGYGERAGYVPETRRSR